MCAYVYESVYVCIMCVCVRQSLCVNLCVYVFMYMCMYVCVNVCTCMYMFFFQLRGVDSRFCIVFLLQHRLSNPWPLRVGLIFFFEKAKSNLKLCCEYRKWGFQNVGCLYCWGFKNCLDSKWKGPLKSWALFSPTEAPSLRTGAWFSVTALTGGQRKESEALLSHCYVPGSLHTLWQLTEVIFGVRPIY